MPKLSKREYVLLAVLAVAVILVLWFNRDSGLFGGAEATADDEPLPGDAPVVEMARLVGEPESYDARGRNLFQYYVPPPPKRPARQPVKPPERKKVTPPPQRPTTTREARKPPAARPPAPSFKYLGFLGPKDAKLAVFEESEELELVAVGDVVKKQFRLIEFKYEGVLLGYTDRRFTGQTTELKQSR